MGSRLLIAAGEAASRGDQLPVGVRGLIDGADEILVVTPSLPSRLEWLASATDRARDQADERLEIVLGHLGEVGGEARGAVGSDDPIEAVADAIRAFSPDHLLIALRPGPKAGWQERGLVEQILDRFGLPVTVFSIEQA
ncbi:MAG TPA: hypothetical protein VKA89_10130 [Solirubrobacterales bacterium]|nr:hypothetical protein [Solirubrobacterales bacterium]